MAIFLTLRTAGSPPLTGIQKQVNFGCWRTLLRPIFVENFGKRERFSPLLTAQGYGKSTWKPNQRRYECAVRASRKGLWALTRLA
jgi:hypothetical protein